MHRLGSPYGQCMVSTGSVDVQLLYNTSYTRQVSLGVVVGVGGLGPWSGAGVWVGEQASGKEGRQAGQGEGQLLRTPSFSPHCPPRPVWSPAFSI